MSLILSIETATPVCAVALHQEGLLLGETRLLKDKSHSEKLAVIIHNIISDCGYKPENLTAVAVSEGPGSYTGLRIGASTAKGLCYGLNIPLIAINTLTALAAQVAPFIEEGDLLLPMLDARRLEVYCQVLNKRLEITQDTKPVVLEESSFCNFFEKHKVNLFGDGASKSKTIITHHNAFFINDIYPAATTIGELAYKKYLKKDFADVVYFEPFYLKEFRAGIPKSLI